MPLDPQTQELIGNVSGPLIAAGLGELLTRGRARKVERLQRWMEQLQGELSRIAPKCDEEVFVDLINRTLLAAATDSRAEKIAVFGLVLRGSYCAQLDDFHARMFVDLAARFDVHHLHVIRVLRDVPGADVGDDGLLPPAVGFAFLDSNLRDLIGRNSAEMTDVTTLTVSDLVNSGLVHTRMNTDSAGKVIVQINPVGLLRLQVFRLSPLGLLFAKYVEANVSAAKGGPLSQ